MINENKTIEIYTSRSCGYCYAAKALLDSRNLDYTEIDVTHDFEMRQEIMKRSQRRTVPQIFIDGKSIGGFQELSELLQNAD